MQGKCHYLKTFKNKYLVIYTFLYYLYHMKKELLKKINADLKKQSLNSLAIKMGLKQSTLYRNVMGTSKGTLATWEIIESYYNKQ